MEARELRIGNVVNALHHKNDSPNPAKFNLPVVVESIAKDRISTSLGELIEIEYLSGIELTEDWLLKMGFEVDVDSNTHNLKKAVIDGFRINTYSDEAVGYWWLGYYHNKKNNHIQYIHQLQNLYFALTGTELTIK